LADEFALKKTLFLILTLLGLLIIVADMVFEVRYTMLLAFPEPVQGGFGDSWELALAPIVYIFLWFITLLSGTIFVLFGQQYLKPSNFKFSLLILGVIYCLQSIFTIIVFTKMFFDFISLNGRSLMFLPLLIYLLVVLFLLFPGIASIFIALRRGKPIKKLNTEN
jgi:hypothetical protein